jgi:phenylalanyl-tRNA synthetase beta subunit
MKSNKNDSKIRVNLNDSTSEVPELTDDEAQALIEKIVNSLKEQADW